MESPLCPPDDPGFRLIETFRWEPGAGVIRRDRHLARLARSAARLGIVPQGAQRLLDGVTGPGPLRCRLSVDRDGKCALTTAPFVPLPAGTLWQLALAGPRLHSGDPWLGVKTTQRALYDSARANLPDGVDEMIFLNERGELCEGTITNLFVRRRDRLLTPPLASGLLPGILRETLLERGEAEESSLTPESLQTAKALYVGNSLRGLIRARLAPG